MGEQRSEEQGYRLTHYKTLAPCRTICSVQQYGSSLISSQKKAGNNSGTPSYSYEEKPRTNSR